MPTMVEAIIRVMYLLSPFFVRRALSFSSHRISRGYRTSSSLLSSIAEQDENYLSQAVDCARLGLGNTFPNPAVGCVLVNDATDTVIGRGFHPQAGFPHAEVFALFEAAGHVESGVEAAISVVKGVPNEEILRLTDTYTSEGGPESLFAGIFSDIPVTAYVTLEPCCHYGQTPPCAGSLALSSVHRVVVGFRDPNPKVDGGGVKVLQEAGIAVDMAEGGIHEECSDIVDAFCKRITPKTYGADYEWVTGAMRRALRKLAGVKKRDGSLCEAAWGGKIKASDESSVDALELDHKWMEAVDILLWQHELVNLRLNKAVGKKKLAQRLSKRVAGELGAHVAQTVGHTSLIFRPGEPSILNLEELVNESKGEETPHAE